MKLCNDCKNLGKKPKCKYYGMGSTYAERCTDYEERKPTNAQKIRSMSDEELAVFLSSTFRIGIKPKDMLQWLKSEVKE